MQKSRMREKRMEKKKVVSIKLEVNKLHTLPRDGGVIVTI
jgi:hypothetical protein